MLKKLWLASMAALLLAWASWAWVDEGAPPTVQETPDGNHYGWDNGNNPHSQDPSSASLVPIPAAGADLPVNAGGNTYLSDYYVGDGPVTLSGGSLRRALGADLRR